VFIGFLNSDEAVCSLDFYTHPSSHYCRENAGEMKNAEKKEKKKRSNQEAAQSSGPYRMMGKGIEYSQSSPRPLCIKSMALVRNGATNLDSGTTSD
jgi:hypothetical protein